MTNRYNVYFKNDAFVLIDAEEFAVDEANNLCFYTDAAIVAMFNWDEWSYVDLAFENVEEKEPYGHTHPLQDEK